MDFYKNNMSVDELTGKLIFNLRAISQKGDISGEHFLIPENFGTYVRFLFGSLKADDAVSLMKNEASRVVSALAYLNQFRGSGLSDNEVTEALNAHKVYITENGAFTKALTKAKEYYERVRNN